MSFPGAVASTLVVAVWLSGIAGVADTLPVYCGAVGAKSYAPPAVTIPPVVLNRGTVITVTNATVAINGDTSSVKALVANPGPDGISLREAIMATNNDRGTWVIQFAPALKGSTIVVDAAPSMGLDFLAGGNVTINGDIDGDGQPDITLSSVTGTGAAFYINSGGNTLYGLALQNFRQGVNIWNPSPGFGFPTAAGTTFSNTTISHLVMTGITGSGIVVCPNCGAPSPAGNTWDHVTITGNTITGDDSGPLQGIVFIVSGPIGDTLQHTTIANNNMVGAGGISIGAGGDIGASNNRVLDTLIANNAITSSHRGIGIGLGGNFSNLQFTGNGDPAGGDGGSGNLIDGLQIIANQIRITGPVPTGVSLTLGDTPSNGFQLPVIQYAENNIARHIGILANTIEGPADTGIMVYAGSGTVRNDTIANLSILGNTITGATRGGVSLSCASSIGAVALSTGNTLSNVLVQANSIQMTAAGKPGLEGGIIFGGIDVLTGSRAQGNSVNSISIANNNVDTGSVGISIIAGSGSGNTGNAPAFPADNNIVSAAQIFCNQVDRAPNFNFTPPPAIKGINVTAGLDNAHGNQVQQLYVKDNLVAGVLGEASLFANLGDGATGNTISMFGSADGPQFTNAGLLSAATLQHRAVAPGSLVSLFGLNLFGFNLDGTTVQFDGVSAPILYASSSQLNLQVPWELQGKWSASVTVTVNGVTSSPQAVALASADPGIFSLGAPEGGQGAIVNAGGTIVDAKAPAHAGDYVQLYATGLGAVNNPPQTGAQAVGALSTLISNPTVTIGGVAGPVSFAGLAPGFVGLYQVNVQVPQGVAAGDAVPVMLSAGAISSNTVTISVR